MFVKLYVLPRFFFVVWMYMKYKQMGVAINKMAISRIYVPLAVVSMGLNHGDICYCKGYFCRLRLFVLHSTHNLTRVCIQLFDWSIKDWWVNSEKHLEGEVPTP